MIIKETPKSHDDLRANFRWSIPERYNIGTACARRHRHSNSLAILDVAEDGTVRSCSFAQLDALSNRFANVLVTNKVQRGDRVAIMASQSIETAAAHLAIYKLGAIAVPMAAQFGHNAIVHRLNVSEAKFAVVSSNVRERFEAAAKSIGVDLKLAVTDGEGEDSFSTLCSKASDNFQAVSTSANGPAMMLFTSGTTGTPKAALHAHRVVPAHVPGIQLSQDLMPVEGDLLWTPSDWAWAGGLLNALLTALSLGVPVVAARTSRFDPHWAASLITKVSVRNLFMPATALRLMLAENVGPLGDVRSIGSAGEALGAETLDRAKAAWGLNINEFYGQTECNTVIGSSSLLGAVKSGSMGKATPGHRVRLLDEQGAEAPQGTYGEIAIHRDSPAMFLGYWRDKAATDAKFSGDWLRTGDEARMDADGFLFFRGRTDDVITTSGYRVGPVEIEDVLTSHDHVSLAAVVGISDVVRTQRITAFVKLQNAIPSPELAQQLRSLVRSRLSPHQTPAEVHFVDHIPTTESGKIIRRRFRENGLSSINAA
ncbi:MAG: AMP-binding protein [Pseudomonadota bacterium]